MEKIRLTASEKVALESRHNACRDSRESDRIKSILLRSEGWTVPMISQALRCHETTITRHLNDYSSGKLNPKNGGSNSLLNAAQTKELVDHLIEHTYQYNHEILAYIESRWSIKYSIPGLNKWLHKNGFSYKKAKGRPYKADVEKQAAFIEEYTKLKERVGAAEPIVFIDSVHPSQATKLSYGWIKTGSDKEVKTTASRTRLNIIGALQLCQISETFITQYDTVNAESVIDFLSQLRNKHDLSKTINVIL